MSFMYRNDKKKNIENIAKYPSIPSVRLIAFIIDRYTKQVKTKLKTGPNSYIPKNPFKLEIMSNPEPVK